MCRWYILKPIIIWLTLYPRAFFSCHIVQKQKYPGEEEAVVNVLLAYVRNAKFGIDLDQAFIDSFPRTGMFENTFTCQLKADVVHCSRID